MGPSVWYAGAPLRYSYSELDHEKVFSLFDLDGSGEVTRRTVPVRPLRELRQVTGLLHDILTGAESDPAPDDYLSVTLTDRGALFDYAVKIRAVYPNVLPIMREQHDGEGEMVSSGELRRLTEQEIVGRFFSHVAGELDEQEQAALLETLDELNRCNGGDACAR